MDRKIEVLKLSEICKVRIPPSDAIRSLALALQKECKLKSKDALHVASAKVGGASHFVTCDDALQISRRLYEGQTDADALKRLLRPAPEELLAVTAVSARVNSVKNDEPSCLEPAPDQVLLRTRAR